MQLMKTLEKNGIAVAGTTVVDKINEIAAYPSAGELTKILSVQKSVGGNVPNVGIDLKKITPDLKVTAIAKIGDDDDGEFVKNILSEQGLELTGLKISEMPTSFTQVMSVPGGQRTFFTFSGADSELVAEDFDLETIAPRILHLAYFLLLKKIDAGEGIKILQKASALGIETSIDLVSENSDRYSLVLPCLPYTDYLIINEIEGGKLAGIEPKEENMRAIAQKLKALGVRKKVILHMRTAAICCSDDGITVVGSVDVPRSEIKGTTGAGDAFCAGALTAIYAGKNDAEILDFASCAAVMSLRSADATSGIRTTAEILDYCKDFPRMDTKI